MSEPKDKDRPALPHPTGGVFDFSATPGAGQQPIPTMGVVTWTQADAPNLAPTPLGPMGVEDAASVSVGQSAAPGAPPSDTKKPPKRLDPREWHRVKKSKWAMTCLAASLSGWDATCEDLEPVTEAEFDAAISLARGKIDECRGLAAQLPGGMAMPASTARRVFALHHPSKMAAVVAIKPTGAEARAILVAAQDEDVSQDMREANTRESFWRAVLWPGPQDALVGEDGVPGNPGSLRQSMVDDDPLGYEVFWPRTFLLAIGLPAGDVRKKL